MHKLINRKRILFVFIFINGVKHYNGCYERKKRAMKNDRKKKLTQSRQAPHYFYFYFFQIFLHTI